MVESEKMSRTACEKSQLGVAGAGGPTTSIRRLYRRAMASPAFWLYALLQSLYLLTAGGQLLVGDGALMYWMTRSLVLDRTLAIGANADPSLFVAGWDGRLYGTPDIGQPILAIPFFLAGQGLALLLRQPNDIPLTVFAVSLVPQIATALSGVVLYWLARELFGSARVAIVLVLVWGTGTLAFPYSKFYFPEPLITLFLLLACWFFVRALRDESGRCIWVAGLALGVAVTIRVSALIYVIPFLVYLGIRWLTSRSRSSQSHLARDGVAFCLGLVPGILVFLFHNYVRFHDLVTTGYQGQSFTALLDVSLIGLLFSPGRGLFIFVPLAGLGLVSLPVLVKQHPEIGSFVASAFLTALVFYGGWWAWHGGWSWGPRFLTPVVPLLILPLGASFSSPRFRAAVAVLWVISLLVVLPGVFVDFNSYFINSLYRDGFPESTLWFDPARSQILIQWSYLLQGQAVSLGGNHLSDFGLPRVANYVYLPTMFAAGVYSLVRLRHAIDQTGAGQGELARPTMAPAAGDYL